MHVEFTDLFDDSLKELEKGLSRKEKRKIKLNFDRWYNLLSNIISPVEENTTMLLLMSEYEEKIPEAKREWYNKTFKARRVSSIILTKDYSFLLIYKVGSCYIGPFVNRSTKKIIM